MGSKVLETTCRSSLTLICKPAQPNRHTMPASHHPTLLPDSLTTPSSRPRWRSACSSAGRIFISRNSAMAKSRCSMAASCSSGWCSSRSSTSPSRDCANSGRNAACSHRSIAFCPSLVRPFQECLRGPSAGSVCSPRRGTSATHTRHQYNYVLVGPGFNTKISQLCYCGVGSPSQIPAAG